MRLTKQQDKKKLVKTRDKHIACWEFFKCKEKECPAFKSKDYRCWLFTGTHCRKQIQGKFIEKMEMCVRCKPFKSNIDPASLETTVKAIDNQFKEYKKLVATRDRELENISMELALGTTEVFEALKKIASGDPTVRLNEKSKIELISKLKHVVNITAKEIGEIVDQSHEVAIGLAELFDVLHKVSKGDLRIRVSNRSKMELLQSLKKITNQTIRSISEEISERMRAEKALQKAHDVLERRVQKRTSDLTAANKQLRREIEDRMRIENSLREAEIRYRTVADFTYDWEYWETTDGKLQYVSPSCERITGYRPEHFFKNPNLLAEIIVPEDKHILNEHHHDAYIELIPRSIAFRIRRKDGKVCWIEHVCQPIIDDKGGFLGFRASNRDITMRKETMESLRGALSLLHATLESTTDGILVVDTHGNISSFNKKFLKMWHIPESIMTSRNDNQVLTFVLDQLQNPESFLAKVRELYNQPDAESYDILIFKDGRIFERYSHPQKIGNSVVGRVWSFRDISERKRAQDKLKESEEKYRQLFVAETDAIIVFDAKTQQIVDVNNAALQIYGYTQKEFLNLKRTDISEDSSDFEESLMKVLSGKIVKIPLLYHKKEDGSIFPVEISTAGFTSKGRKMVFEVIKDITEQKQSEEALKESHENLRALSTHITQIEEAERLRLSRELHDQVGQKLTALNMNLEFLTKQVADQSKMRIVSRLDDSKELVKDIMKLVRHIMADLRPRILDDYGLEAAIHWYTDLFSKRTNIPILFKGDNLEQRLQSDIETNLFRILQESLTNIAKHAKANKITITLKKREDAIKLTIADNGIGFDPIIIKYPQKPRGLGLIGMRERAESIGGKLQVKSSQGKGTKITVEVRRYNQCR